MENRILNINVGLLGHVDSGKTSLAKSLSVTPSTASFDKNPQSRERGITIDLGFSSLSFPMPSVLKDEKKKFEILQFTLVDCPGHASLIRTIIGGSQIIDMMILVLDITKGVQTQTAECLVIGEITCSKMIVVINKIDLIHKDKRQSMIDKMSKKMKLTLANTVFRAAPVVSVAAKPGGVSNEEHSPIGMDELLQSLQDMAFVPERFPNLPLLFSVDHCFTIRGQGTVLTGTVLQGAVSINDTIEIPSIQITKKVKCLQVYRQPVVRVEQGDRVGVCVTQFDPKLLERGIACCPGYVPTVYAVIASFRKVNYYKGKICSKAKFHISLGHETVIGKISIFESINSLASLDSNFDYNANYTYVDEVKKQHCDEAVCAENCNTEGEKYMLIEFENPVVCAPNSLIIGSKLEMDLQNMCRLAFYGKLFVNISDKNYRSSILPLIKVFKAKSKQGIVERVVNKHEVIGKSMFKKESNLQPFVGLKVVLSTGEEGIIESTFGLSGKFKVRLPGGLSDSTTTSRSKRRSKQVGDQNKTPPSEETIYIHLFFKRNIYDRQKNIVQI